MVEWSPVVCGSGMRPVAYEECLEYAKSCDYVVVEGGRIELKSVEVSRLHPTRRSWPASLRLSRASPRGVVGCAWG